MCLPNLFLDAVVKMVLPSLPALLGWFEWFSFGLKENLFGDLIPIVALNVSETYNNILLLTRFQDLVLLFYPLMTLPVFLNCVELILDEQNVFLEKSLC